MIERKFVAQKFREFHIKEHMKSELNRVGLSDVKLQRTSVGEKIVIYANRPGLVVGRGGSVIQKLTGQMKDVFKLENPQIEIEEVKDANVNANIIAEYIVNQLERFGSQRFKGIGHKSIARVMSSGALGVEILISGKIPSSRAKRWRFVDGYMKKCGDIAITGVDTTKTFANLKTGIVGIQVKIMPATTVLPDKIDIVSGEPIVEEIKVEPKEKPKKETKEEKPKKKVTKKTTKKTPQPKKEEKSKTDKPNSESKESANLEAKK